MFNVAFLVSEHWAHAKNNKAKGVLLAAILCPLLVLQFGSLNSSALLCQSSPA